MIKDATVQRHHNADHAQLRGHLENFINAYNDAQRLKILRRPTPFEFVTKCRTNRSI